MEVSELIGVFLVSLWFIFVIKIEKNHSKRNDLIFLMIFSIVFTVLEITGIFNLTYYVTYYWRKYGLLLIIGSLVGFIVLCILAIMYGIAEKQVQTIFKYIIAISFFLLIISFILIMVYMIYYIF